MMYPVCQSSLNYSHSTDIKRFIKKCSLWTDIKYYTIPTKPLGINLVFLIYLNTVFMCLWGDFAVREDNRASNLNVNWAETPKIFEFSSHLWLFVYLLIWINLS